MQIRETTGRDAGALLALKSALDRETSFMLVEPGERTTIEEEAAEQLRVTAERSNSFRQAAVVVDDQLWMAKLLESSSS